MKSNSAKIALIFVIGSLLFACDSTKRIPQGKKLLVTNTLQVNDKKVGDEEITGLIIQRPNTKVLGIPFSLHVYNTANPNPDSTFKANILDNPRKFKNLSALLSKKQVYRLGESFWYKGFHNFLKRTGEAPVIYEEAKTKKSLEMLRRYYFNEGYFNVKGSYTIDSAGAKKSKALYSIQTGKPYFLDTISASISSPDLDSLYQLNKQLSFIKSGQQYKASNFSEERNRLTTYFRNNGIYNFQQSYINFNIIDTATTNYKPNVELIIEDYNYREGDSMATKPFEVYKISEVNIYTDNIYSKDKVKVADSVTYQNFNLYSRSKLKYKPKAITNAVFITPGSVYADFRTNLTSRYLSNLRIFNYPSIQYVEDKRDSSVNALIANIYLIPKQKYSFGAAFDLTHSNIQDFGITGNVSTTIRNVFRGAETLEIAGKANVGSSRQVANPNDNFFNISEYGADIRLNFPRIFSPFNTEKIIPKRMIPSTLLSAGFAKQQNIGLDKENLTGSFTYSWNPNRLVTSKFDLVNVQYVKNINTGNYFTVYRSSYAALNSIAEEYQSAINDEYLNDNGDLIIDTGTTGFIQDVIGQNPLLNLSQEDEEAVRSIEERRRRLTENNLIIASSYTYSKTTKSGLMDNDFYVFRTKLEIAGNVLSMLSKLSDQSEGVNGNRTVFDIEFSQYAKTEFEFVKHWDLHNNKVFAIRSFAAIAIPYGNSDNIPFSRSYFAGGSNDNRSWQPYSLGPGKSGARNDFNEANMKLAVNAEFRFKIFGGFRGALFTDVGNIWNVLDNVKDPDFTFTGFKSLQDLAVGSGFGLRYDFGFVVARLDLGFKVYNPSSEETKKWMRDFNFAKSVLNVGINYPF